MPGNAIEFMKKSKLVDIYYNEGIDQQVINEKRARTSPDIFHY